MVQSLSSCIMLMATIIVASNVRKCALDGETCSCNGLVQYGIGTIYTPWKQVSGEIQCTRTAFDDPRNEWATNARKKCFCKTEATTTSRLISTGMPRTGSFQVGDQVMIIDSDETACVASVIDESRVTINYSDGITLGEEMDVALLSLIERGSSCEQVSSEGEDPEEEIDEEDSEFENPSGETPSFPAFNQQCQDDAGPRWVEDLQRFGQDRFYWSDSHARAVLNQDGTCPAPVEEACQTRKNPLQAFVEGPISCPDAWACRIYPDPNHGSGYDFLGDRNFGNCDRPDSDLWEHTMTDQDGHCHGGLDPSSYYWWVRDHWNRPYSGRVKCCCVESMEIGNTGKRTMNLDGIANRCDYRAKVTVDVNECRDANEDHAGGQMGSGFLYGYDGPGGFGEAEGCPRTADGKVAYTREPADEMCWEILNFGLPDENDNDPTIFESSTGPCTGAGSATAGSCDGVEAFPGQFSGPEAPQYVRPSSAGPFNPIATRPSNTGLPETTFAVSTTSQVVSTQESTGFLYGQTVLCFLLPYLAFML